MLLLTLDIVLAGICAWSAYRALPRGLSLLRLGYDAVKTAVTNSPDVRRDIAARRAVSDGGRYMLSGFAWLFTGALFSVATVYFIAQLTTRL